MCYMTPQSTERQTPEKMATLGSAAPSSSRRASHSALRLRAARRLSHHLLAISEDCAPRTFAEQMASIASTCQQSPFGREEQLLSSSRTRRRAPTNWGEPADWHWGFGGVVSPIRHNAARCVNPRVGDVNWANQTIWTGDTSARLWGLVSGCVAQRSRQIEEVITPESRPARSVSHRGNLRTRLHLQSCRLSPSA